MDEEFLQSAVVGNLKQLGRNVVLILSHPQLKEEVNSVELGCGEIVDFLPYLNWIMEEKFYFSRAQDEIAFHHLYQPNLFKISEVEFEKRLIEKGISFIPNMTLEEMAIDREKFCRIKDLMLKEVSVINKQTTEVVIDHEESSATLYHYLSDEPLASIGVGKRKASTQKVKEKLLKKIKFNRLIEVKISPPSPTVSSDERSALVKKGIAQRAKSRGARTMAGIYFEKEEYKPEKKKEE